MFFRRGRTCEGRSGGVVEALLVLVLGDPQAVAKGLCSYPHVLEAVPCLLSISEHLFLSARELQAAAVAYTSLVWSGPVCFVHERVWFRSTKGRQILSRAY